MQKAYLYIGIILIIVVGLFFFSKREVHLPSSIPETVSPQTVTPPIATPPPSAKNPVLSPSPIKRPIVHPAPPSKNQGRLIIAVTDAAASMESIQEVRLTINEVKVQNSAKQWIRVSSTPRYFELLKLDRDAAFEVFADTNLAVGSYEKISITLGDVAVIKNGVAYSAKLPSRDFTVGCNIIITSEGRDTVATFDFQADKSLQTTEKNAFIFAPVVRLQTRSLVETQIFSGILHSVGGKTDTDITVGMNESGIIKIGFMFDKNTKLDIIGDAIRIIPPGENSSSIVITAEAALNIAIQKGYITSALSIKTMIRSNRFVWQIVGIKDLSTVIIYIDVSTGEVVSVE